MIAYINTRNTETTQCCTACDWSGDLFDCVRQQYGNRHEYKIEFDCPECGSITTEKEVMVLGKGMTKIDLWEEQHGEPRNKCLPPFAL